MQLNGPLQCKQKLGRQMQDILRGGKWEFDFSRQLQVV